MASLEDRIESITLLSCSTCPAIGIINSFIIYNNYLKFEKKEQRHTFI